MRVCERCGERHTLVMWRAHNVCGWCNEHLLRIVGPSDYMATGGVFIGFIEQGDFT